MPVPEVADASGFQSREYLAWAFKRATKMTPREYRARVSRSIRIVGVCSVPLPRIYSFPLLRIS